MGLALSNEPVSVESLNDDEVADVLIEKLSKLSPFARSQKKMPAGKDPSGKDILITTDELVALLRKRPLPPEVQEHIEAQKYLMGGGFQIPQKVPAVETPHLTIVQTPAPIESPVKSIRTTAGGILARLKGLLK